MLVVAIDDIVYSRGSSGTSTTNRGQVLVCRFLGPCPDLTKQNRKGRSCGQKYCKREPIKSRRGKDVFMSEKEVKGRLDLFKMSLYLQCTLFKTPFIPELFPRTSYQAPRALKFTSEKSTGTTGNICGLQLTQLIAFPQLLHHCRTQANICCKDVTSCRKNIHYQGELPNS